MRAASSCLSMGEKTVFARTRHFLAKLSLCAAVFVHMRPQGDGAGLALKSKPLPVPSRGHPVTAPHGRHETADLQGART